MLLRDLHEQVEALMAQFDPDSTQVLLAVQPSWPLAHDISNITEIVDESSLVDCDCEDPEQCGKCCGTGKLEPDDATYTVWIAASHGHPDGRSPYAPSDAWQ